MSGHRLLLASSLFVALFAFGAAAQIYLPDLPIDHPAIRYTQTQPDDPVSRLAARLEQGAISLDFRQDGTGYLASVLDQLGVSADSQGLVFSKTSSQAARISPRTPRAIYFADDVAVGFVRGGEALEIAARDPRQGVHFYTFDNRAAAGSTFTRQTVCLRCHLGPATNGVPGMFVSSVFPSASGMPHARGAIVTDHRTPFADRWGGWYVNGTHGETRHRGNAVAPNPAQPEVLDTIATQNLRTLAGRVDTTGYLRPTSDIVALMTFEHQTQMINLMTRLGWEARIAERDLHTVSTPALDASINAFVAYMLFEDEPPLRDVVEGVSPFTRIFPQHGPRDRRGRSLRDFDLKTRLFRYPLSYLIYDSAFDALPAPILERVYHRLFERLTASGGDQQASSRPPIAERRAIIEILTETKPGLPAYWRSEHALAHHPSHGRPSEPPR